MPRLSSVGMYGASGHRSERTFPHPEVRGTGLQPAMRLPLRRGLWLTPMQPRVQQRWLFLEGDRLALEEFTSIGVNEPGRSSPGT